jgi:hypothetical protein
MAVPPARLLLAAAEMLAASVAAARQAEPARALRGTAA